MRLYLVRHGQTSWNVALRAQGHSDVPLDSTGHAQAERLGKAFAGLKVREVICSDLRRASETGRFISESTGSEFTLTRELRERSFGSLEGLHFDEVGEFFKAQYEKNGTSPQQARPPGGESLADCWARAEGVVESLVGLHDPVALVSHGGMCALLLACVVDGSVRTARAFRFGNASITELARRPDGSFFLVRYNDTSHLDGLDVKSGGADGAHH